MASPTDIQKSFTEDELSYEFKYKYLQYASFLNYSVTHIICNLDVATLGLI